MDSVVAKMQHSGLKGLNMLNETPYIGAVGRLLIAVLFLISGLGKIAAPAMMQRIIASAGLVEIVASVMAVFTVAAALGFHRNFADQNAMAHFLKNISITGGLLQIAAFGAGSFSIDSRVAKSDLTGQGLALDKHHQQRANI